MLPPREQTHGFFHVGMEALAPHPPPFWNAMAPGEISTAAWHFHNSHTFFLAAYFPPVYLAKTWQMPGAGTEELSDEEKNEEEDMPA